VIPSLEDVDDLPPTAILAQEIVDDLEVAKAEFPRSVGKL